MCRKALRMEIDAWYDDPDSKARPGRPKIKRTREDTNAAKTTNSTPEASSLVPMPKDYGDRQLNAVNIPKVKYA